MLCNKSGICTRKAAFGFGPYALCRKHTAEMQESRRGDLRIRGLDPIGHKPTQDDLYRWVYGLALNYVAGGVD